MFDDASDTVMYDLRWMFTSNMMLEIDSLDGVEGTAVLFTMTEAIKKRE